jgi:hypothetical protein
VVQRRAAVVQHAHREDGIEGVQRRKLLNAQRQQMRALVVAQQLTHRFKLAQEQLGGIDADRQMRAGADHAPHVIAAAAAHVEDGRPVRSDRCGRTRSHFQSERHSVSIFTPYSE